MGQWNLDNVSSLGADVGEGVGWVDDDTGEDSLDLRHENLGVLDFLLDEIAVPGSQTIVVDGEALWWSVVEEGDFVGDVHANWVSNQSFAAFNLIERNKI